jgi:hypothetical protein
MHENLIAISCSVIVKYDVKKKQKNYALDSVIGTGRQSDFEGPSTDPVNSIASDNGMFRILKNKNLSTREKFISFCVKVIYADLRGEQR